MRSRLSLHTFIQHSNQAIPPQLHILSPLPFPITPQFPPCLCTYSSCISHSISISHPVGHSTVRQSHTICHSTVSTLSLPSPMHPICHYTVFTLFFTPQSHPICHSTVFTQSVTPQSPAPYLSLYSCHSLSLHSPTPFCHSSVANLFVTPQSHHVCHLKLLASRIALHGSPHVCSLLSPTMPVTPWCDSALSHHIGHSTVPPYQSLNCPTILVTLQSHHTSHSTVPPYQSLHSPTISVTP